LANDDNHEVLTRYLLGDLPELERESLEEKYFLNDGVWEALNAAEQDLIDLYVRDGLPQRQKEQFESYFLESPRNRAKLEFARTLLSYDLRMPVVAEAAEKPRWRGLTGFFGGSWRPAFNMAPAAGAVAAAVVIILLVIHHQKLKDEARQKSLPQGVQQAQSQPTPFATSPEKTPDETTAHIGHELATVAIVLTPGMVRDTSGNNQIHRLMITDATETVLLHLDMEEDAYPHYEVEIRTAEGKVIKHLDGLKGRSSHNSGHIVIVKLLAQSLVKGDYIVKLSGRAATGEAQDVDSYTFSVIR